MNIQDLENEKVELVNDLLATITVMEELWRFHPENPNMRDVTSEYKILEKIKANIEQEIKELEV
tara:strand:- start:387 stop:578 length:192 start_codon:yes stop_codon:yes gene_type:complete